MGASTAEDIVLFVGRPQDQQCGCAHKVRTYLKEEASAYEGHMSIPCFRIFPRPQAHERLFDMEHSCVELQHEHSDGGASDVRYCSGNEEPHRGFGHLAFLTDDVYKASKDLEKAGVDFKKRPGELVQACDWHRH